MHCAQQLITLYISLQSKGCLSTTHCGSALLCRFWHYPLPHLPPKLQPVDAVLVEDVDGKLGSGMQSVCQQLPALLNAEGVCVVVVGAAVPGVSTPGAAAAGAADGTGKQLSTSLKEAKDWLLEAGLVFVRDTEIHYRSGSCMQTAYAGVWMSRSC